MSWGGSWIAVRDTSVEAALQARGLRRTGTLVDETENALIAGGMLKSGWWLVIASARSGFLFDQDDVAEFSRGGEGVYCSFEEHVMYSCAAFWRDGKCVWSVEREMDRPYAQLNVEGEPPLSFAERRARLFSMQEEAGGEKARVDYIYDLPIELAEEATGFNYNDALHPLGFEIFEFEPQPILQSPAPQTPPPRKPWWKVW